MCDRYSGDRILNFLEFPYMLDRFQQLTLPSRLHSVRPPTLLHIGNRHRCYLFCHSKVVSPFSHISRITIQGMCLGVLDIYCPMLCGHCTMSALNGNFFFSSRRRHTRWNCDWSSDVCS